MVVMLTLNIKNEDNQVYSKSQETIINDLTLSKATSFKKISA